MVTINHHKRNPIPWLIYLTEYCWYVIFVLSTQVQLIPNDSFCIPVHQPEQFGSEVIYIQNFLSQSISTSLSLASVKNNTFYSRFAFQMLMINVLSKKSLSISTYCEGVLATRSLRDEVPGKWYYILVFILLWHLLTNLILILIFLLFFSSQSLVTSSSMVTVFTAKAGQVWASWPWE